MTHDSIGLGEDGPTHQPIEQLASLRAIPGLHVFRPADVVETMEAYQIALNVEGPSLFAFSRQGVEQVRRVVVDENLTARGAYVIREPNGARDVTLLATGTEVSIAIDAAERLAASGINAAVVSMPCWSLFEAQETAYKERVLGSVPRLAIEAASAFGWTRYVASEDNMIGVNTFGESASAGHLYAQFGLTVENVLLKAKALIEDSKIASAA